MAWTLLPSQSASPVTQMSLHTDMEGRHLAGLDSPASTNYPCKAPGSILLETRH